MRFQIRHMAQRSKLDIRLWTKCGIGTKRAAPPLKKVTYYMNGNQTLITSLEAISIILESWIVSFSGGSKYSDPNLLNTSAIFSLALPLVLSKNSTWWLIQLKYSRDLINSSPYSLRDLMGSSSDIGTFHIFCCRSLTKSLRFFRLLNKCTYWAFIETYPASGGLLSGSNTHFCHWEPVFAGDWPFLLDFVLEHESSTISLIRTTSSALQGAQ